MVAFPQDIRDHLGEVQERNSSLEIPWLHGGNPLKIVRHLFPFGRQFRARQPDELAPPVDFGERRREVSDVVRMAHPP